MDRGLDSYFGIAVIDAIGHQVPLFVDGGVRRGTDILKVGLGFIKDTKSNM